jgi:hypothetical protein
MTLSYFQTQLAPYGQWVDVPGYGQCWVPAAQAAVPDWRPYLNGGHWIYTDEGWTWQSDYPWGEYAFHYGRWFRDVRYGWVWMPGYNWGPGWVCWRQAEAQGYCGWAPLPPGATYDPTVGLLWNGHAAAMDVDFGLAPDLFVFIPFDHFWGHDYLAFRAPGWRVSVLFRASFLANHWGFVGGRFVFDGIGRDRMAALTHHEVRVESFAFHDAHIIHAREVERTHFNDFHGGGAVRGGGGFDHGRDGGGSRDHDHDGK